MGAVIVGLHFEGAVRGSLEGSRGDRALVYNDTITELPVHHSRGLHSLRASLDAGELAKLATPEACAPQPTPVAPAPATGPGAMGDALTRAVDAYAEAATVTLPEAEVEVRAKLSKWEAEFEFDRARKPSADAAVKALHGWTTDWLNGVFDAELVDDELAEVMSEAARISAGSGEY